MKKVAYLHRRIPHYRIPFFNSLIESNIKKLTISILASPLEFHGGSGLIVDYKNLHNIKLFQKVKLPLVKNFYYQKYVISDIMQNNYDLIVVEGTVHYLSSWMILILRKLRGKKNIVWLKGWPFDKKTVIRKFVKKCFLRLADQYLVYGKASVDLLKQFGVPPDRITVAQNTVDYDEILNGAETSSKNQNCFEFIQKKYVFYFGRLVEKKKVEDLLEAYRLLHNEYNEVVLVIAGEGPSKKSLSDYAEKKNIEGVYFLGTVSDDELAVLLINAACCVFPGAVGLSINVAMAAGKLVISADEPGPDSELIIHNKTGIRFEKGNIKELSEILKEVFNNKELLKIGINAKQYIIEHATIANMVANHSKVLMELT